jgi:hypothetical protein
MGDHLPHQKRKGKKVRRGSNRKERCHSPKRKKLAEDEADGKEHQNTVEVRSCGVAALRLCAKT